MELNELTNGELKVLYMNSNSKIKKEIRTELKCRGKYKLYITKDEMIDVLNNRINKAIKYVEKNIVDYITNYDDLRENLLDILKGSDKE